MGDTGSPFRNREAEDSIGIASVAFPAKPRKGVVRVKIRTGQKLDEQNASGTDKARTKKNGKKPAVIKLEFEYTYDIWDETEALRTKLDPDGPEGGGPFAVVHPEFGRRRVQFMIAEDMSELEILPGGAAYRFSVDAKQWVPPPTPKPGSGTSTPTKGEEWFQAKNENRGEFREGSASTAVGASGTGIATNGPDEEP